MRKNHLALAIATAVLLAACGGGGSSGGNVRPNPPPPAPPPPPPPPATCDDPKAENTGDPLPCVYRYTGIQDNHLVPTNVDRAHEAGFTGAGVKVGFLDSARVDNDPTLQGKVAFYEDFVGSTTAPDGHGPAIGAVIAGRPGQNVDGTQFAGGVASGANLYWARVCGESGENCRSNHVAAGMSALAGRGVRLFNLSIGGADGTGQTGAINAWAAALQPAVDANGLAIVGNGNDSTANPSALSLVPSLHPDYLGHLITVGAIEIDADGDPAGLAAYSNRCGSAAEWCLVAPGRVVTPAIPGTGYQYGGDGTSVSTGVVSGVAAIVWQAFPWMTGENVQTTLLTTATDLGAPGVDPIYGWGLVNAGKAIAGPAQFIRDFDAAVTAGNWTFSNDITGAGGLVLSGAGSLELSGLNTYAGLTSIEGGHLRLSGSIAGDVSNQGVFDSLGGTVGGNYTAGEDSITGVRVGDGFSIGGTAYLDGTLRLLAPTGAYEPQDQETVITAGAIDGEFKDVTAGSGFFYSAELDYTDATVVANLTRTSAAAATIAAGAQAPVVTSAARVDALLDFIDANRDSEGVSVLSAAAGRIVAYQTEAAALTGLASMSGEVHGTIRAAGIEQVQGDALLLSDRVADLRHVSDGPSGWIQATGRRADYSNGDYADASVNGWGVMAGMDTNLGDSRIGVALGTSRMDGDLDGLAGEFNARREGLALYMRSDLGQAYVGSQLGYGRLKVDTRRSILLADGVERVASNRSDSFWNARVEVGVNGEMVTPFVALGAVQHQQGAFTEAGADGLGLSAGEDHHLVGYGELGARFEWGNAAGGTLGAFLSGRWTFVGRDSAYNTSFTGAPDVRFLADGQRMPGFVARGGVRYLTADRNGWQGFVQASAEASGDGVRDASVGIGLRVGF